MQENNFFEKNSDFDGMNAKLKRRVMRRVYLLWFLGSMYAQFGALAAIMAAASLFISFQDVARNFLGAYSGSHSLFNGAKYITSSFLAADLVSKIFTAVLPLVALLVAWEFFKNRKVTKIFNILNIIPRLRFF